MTISIEYPVLSCPFLHSFLQLIASTEMSHAEYTIGTARNINCNGSTYVNRRGSS
jgi:hypothetical protein